jgi:hypothetical protein
MPVDFRNALRTARRQLPPDYVQHMLGFVQTIDRRLDDEPSRMCGPGFVQPAVDT